MAAAKMKIGGFKTPLWNACSDDDRRPVLNCAYVKDGKIVATDVHILIWQSLTEIHGIEPEQAKLIEGKFFHRELLKEMSKCEIITFTEDGIQFVKGKIKGTFDYTDISEKYPDFEALFTEWKPEEKSKIGVNPRLLEKLRMCFSNPNSTFALTIGANNSHIKVTSRAVNQVDEMGVIMPVMLNENF